MAETYTKLFNTIITSSIWGEDDKTRILWITMLAAADFNGIVQGSIGGLARLASISYADCERVISRLQEPDPDSRTKDNDGRRITPVDGGWMILNYAKYREKQGSRAEYYRKYRATIAQQERNKAQLRATHTDTDTDNIIILFEIARKKFPGRKRGLMTEYENFTKKHPDSKDVVKLLAPAIDREIRYKSKCKAAGRFVESWKHFKTWINNRCWEDEIAEDKPADPYRRCVCGQVAQSGKSECAACEHARLIEELKA